MLSVDDDIKLRRDANSLLTLLCRSGRSIEWCFTEEEDELLAALIPSLPNGEHLVLRTLPAGGESSTGFRVWHSAPVLCRWLRTISLQIEGTAVIDLGCGTGACGLYCAALGAARVVLTDGGSPLLLGLARSNLAANCRRHAQVAAADSQVRWLSWGCDALNLPIGYFCWILGSDIIYDPAHHDALCRTLRVLLQRREEHVHHTDKRPRAVLCSMPRGRVEIDCDVKHNSKVYSDASVVQFTATAAKHALCVVPIARTSTDTDANVSAGHSTVPAFHWSATEFRTAGPFVMEVMESRYVISRLA